jgi:hypothetical protein
MRKIKYTYHDIKNWRDTRQRLSSAPSTSPSWISPDHPLYTINLELLSAEKKLAIAAAIKSSLIYEDLNTWAAQFGTQEFRQHKTCHSWANIEARTPGAISIVTRLDQVLTTKENGQVNDQDPVNTLTKGHLIPNCIATAFEAAATYICPHQHLVPYNAPPIPPAVPYGMVRYSTVPHGR